MGAAESKSDIAGSLDTIVRLLAMQCAAGKSKTDAIVMLSAAGIDRNVIAELLDTTPSMVSKTVSTTKAKRGRSK